MLSRRLWVGRYTAFVEDMRDALGEGKALSPEAWMVLSPPGVSPPAKR